MGQWVQKLYKPWVSEGESNTKAAIPNKLGFWSSLHPVRVWVPPGELSELGAGEWQVLVLSEEQMRGGEQDDKVDEETEVLGGEDAERWEVTFPEVQGTNEEELPVLK